ncbi:MAG: choice-of-anchor Q domain-containing protein [Lysobacterales bacterium]
MIALLAALLCLGGARAGTVSVCTNGCDFSSIQVAINASEPGGTVVLFMTSAHTEVDILITKDIVIEGLDQQQTIVQAAAAPQSDAGRVFTVFPGRTVTFRDFTIRHGDTSTGDGGGIWVQPSDTPSLVTLTRVTIESNRALEGGGIFNEARLIANDFVVKSNLSRGLTAGGITNSGEMELRDGRVINNIGRRRGGGIYNGKSNGVPSSLTLSNVEVGANEAQNGAGIYNTGAMDISGSLVLFNIGSANTGGGIHTSGDSAVVIRNTDISGNTMRALGTANLKGGAGIYASGPVQIIDSDIRLNNNLQVEGVMSGGGLLVDSTNVSVLRTRINFNKATNGAGISMLNSSVMVRASVIDGNAAERDGGGIAHAGGTLDLTNASVLENTADRFGGGLYGCNGDLRLAHVTVAGNEADANNDGDGDGGGFFVADGVCLGGEVTLRNSIIAENAVPNSGLYPDCNVPFTGSFSMIGNPGPSVGERCRVDSSIQLGMLYNINPGTFDAATGFGRAYAYPLKQASLAIDAGTCTDSDGALLAFDQRGAPMPIDGDNDGDADCDMGAAEYASLPVLSDVMFLDGFE